MNVSGDYAILRETGVVECKDRTLVISHADTTADQRREWRETVVAPWWGAMAERAGGDGYEIECLILGDNSHDPSYAWPVVRHVDRSSSDTWFPMTFRRRAASFYRARIEVWRARYL
jgi:hypothetical protein